MKNIDISFHLQAKNQYKKLLRWHIDFAVNYRYKNDETFFFKAPLRPSENLSFISAVYKR